MERQTAHILRVVVRYLTGPTSISTHCPPGQKETQQTYIVIVPLPLVHLLLHRSIVPRIKPGPFRIFSAPDRQPCFPHRRRHRRQRLPTPLPLPHRCSSSVLLQVMVAPVHLGIATSQYSGRLHHIRPTSPINVDRPPRCR